MYIPTALKHALSVLDRAAERHAEADKDIRHLVRRCEPLVRAAL